MPKCKTCKYHYDFLCYGFGEFRLIGESDAACEKYEPKPERQDENNEQ